MQIGPARFFGIGVFLFAIKFVLDRTVASMVFGRDWSVFNYLIPNETYSLATLPPPERIFYLAMLAVALPFVCIGIIVTLRRLRDAGLPCWLALLFFVPAVNLLFFAVLSVFPSAMPAPSEILAAKPMSDSSHRVIPLTYAVSPEPMPTVFDKFLPRAKWSSAVVATFSPAPLALGATLLAANFFRDYGWGLFVGMPFCVGLLASMLYSYRARRTLLGCVGVSSMAFVASGAAIFGFAVEGLGCLIMLLPLALPIAILGGIVGYTVQRVPEPYPGISNSIWATTLALPLLIAAEGMSPRQPALFAVTTCVEISAVPSEVWHNVVSFSDIHAPLDWVFASGVAYPIRARIEGAGVGAVRYCEFSTGPFVEPISVWDEPRLLKFAVTSNPTPMREWSPFNIHPPHLNNFLVSHGGQFHLIALDNGHTRLEGTTWYEHRMCPQTYWRWWSDFLIHRIHARVLDHVKRLSEEAQTHGEQHFVRLNSPP